MNYSELEWKENSDCNEYTIYKKKTITIFQIENLYGYYIGKPILPFDLHYGFTSKEVACQYAMKELS